MVGVEIYDANGQKIVDINDRIARFTGSLTITAGTTGSTSVPEFAQGAPFLVAIPLDEGNPAYAYYSGTTLYWRYEPGGFAANVNTLIHYGVY